MGGDPVSFSFSRLKFYSHGKGARKEVQATFFFPNGYGASIVQGEGHYGDLEEDTYEVAVLVAYDRHGKDWQITYDTSVAHDVLGWLTREGVEQVLDQIAALPSRDLKAKPVHHVGWLEGEDE